MKWTDCTDDNKDFTSKYDAAVPVIRKTLGSYDHIAHLLFSEAGVSVSGVSVRRWLLGRNLPVNYACTLIELTLQKDKNAKVGLGDLFPYLEDFFCDYLD